MKKLILDALKIKGFAENKDLLIQMLFIAYKMGAVNQVCAIGAENLKTVETPQEFEAVKFHLRYSYMKMI